MKFNNTQRAQEELQVVAFLKQQGLQVSTPDLVAFRQHAQAVYAPSDMAKTWPEGLMDRIRSVR